MKRATRIYLNLFAPPAIATALVTVGPVFTRLPISMVERLQIVVLTLVFAYIFALLPSGLHAWVMEIGYRRWATPEKWKAVMLSAASGLMGGVFVVLLIHTASGRWKRDPLWGLLIFPAVGLTAGFLLGLLVKALSRAPVKVSHEPNSRPPLP